MSFIENPNHFLPSDKCNHPKKLFISTFSVKLEFELRVYKL
jgi:hypothetical protein